MKRLLTLKRMAVLLLMLVMLLQTVAPVTVFAAPKYSGNGIANNGHRDIYINIYADPYTRYAQDKEFGKWAYTDAGCAWFATSRAAQVTGRNFGTIYGGPNWFNKASSTFHYGKGFTPKAQSLACYENHVAFVENVIGGTVVVSEGGAQNKPGNDYCVIHDLNMEQIKGNSQTGRILGYVYLRGDPNNPSVVFANTQVQNLKETDARLYTDPTADVWGRFTTCGVTLWDASGRQIGHKEEQAHPNFANNNHLPMYYDVQAELGVALTPGKDYTYQFYTDFNGRRFYTQKMGFRTPGGEPNVGFEPLEVQNLQETDARLYTDARANMVGQFTTCGVRLWDASGRQIGHKEEQAHPNFAHANHLVMYYDIQKELGVTLTPGTDYSYQFYTTFNGKPFSSAKMNFKTPGAPQITMEFSPLEVRNLTETDARLYTDAKANMVGQFTTCGVRLWDASGRQIGHKEEQAVSSHAHADHLVMFYDVQKELGVTLTPGADYSYQFYTTFNGKSFSSAEMNFKTPGAPQITMEFSPLEVRNLTETDARLYTDAKANMVGQFTTCGVRLWDASGRQIGHKEEQAVSSHAHADHLVMFYDVQKELGVTLTPGADYSYQFYTTFNGKSFTSILMQKMIRRSATRLLLHFGAFRGISQRFRSIWIWRTRC